MAEKNIKENWNRDTGIKERHVSRFNLLILGVLDNLNEFFDLKCTYKYISEFTY